MRGGKPGRGGPPAAIPGPSGRGVREGLGDLLRDGERLVDRNRSLFDALRQRRPFDQFQDQRPHALGLFQPVDAPDVRVVQRGQDLGFPLEAGQPVGVGRERLGQYLQCDIAIELRVAGLVDLTHPASANQADDFVRANLRAFAQGHWVRQSVFMPPSPILAVTV